jgi:hypothetical protein
LTDNSFTTVKETPLLNLLLAAAVIVKPGDTLSGIAEKDCHNSSDWTGTYAANRRVIGPDANLILPGQKIKVVCRTAPWTAPVQTAAVVQHAAPAPVQQAATAPVSHAAASSGGTTVGNTSFEQCVISRESGGNSQVMNASGHYGLYQFALGTWVAYGGNAADFGHASVAEQNRIFNNAIAAGGQSNWAPYDGC